MLSKNVDFCICFCADQLNLYCQRTSHQEVVSSMFLQKTQVLEEPCGPNEAKNVPVCFSIRLEIASISGLLGANADFISAPKF